MRVSVSLGLMLTACNDPMLGSNTPAAFVHRRTGDVLFVALNDEAAAIHFTGVARDLEIPGAAIHDDLGIGRERDPESAAVLPRPKNSARVSVPCDEFGGE
jgi:hypothetical protein